MPVEILSKAPANIAPEVLALSSQPLFSTDIQRQMVQQALEAFSDIFLSAVPKWIKLRGNELDPPFVIPKKEEIYESPSLIVEQLKVLTVHLKNDRLKEDKLPTLNEITKAAIVLCASLRVCSNGLGNLAASSSANLGTLEQRSRIFAFLSADLGNLFDIPEPPPVEAPIPEVIEPPSPIIEPVIPKETGLNDLLALLERQEPKNLVTQLEPKEIIDTVPVIEERIAAREFKRSWSKPGAVLFAASILTAETYLVYNGHIAIQLKFLLAISAATYFFIKLLNRQTKDAEIEGKKEIAEQQILPSIAKRNDQIEAPQSKRAEDTMAPLRGKPSEQKEFALNDTQQGGKTHIVGRDIEGAHGPGSFIGTIMQGTSQKLSELMCVQNPLVVTSRDGQLKPLSKWLHTLSDSDRENAISILYATDILNSPIKDSDLTADEAELQFLVSGQRAILPLPPNFRITQLEFINSENQVLTDTYPLEVIRCRLGSAVIDRPADAHSVRYRLMPDSGRTDTDCTNQAESALYALLPKFEVKLPPALSLYKETLEKLEAPAAEKIALWYRRLEQEKWLYSMSPFVGNVLKFSGENLPEALISMQVATCEPFALITAMTCQAFKAPVFLLEGLVPTDKGNGDISFKALTGHSQTCAFIDGQSYALDLTTAAQKVLMDISHIPLIETNSILQKLGNASQEETLVLADRARTLIEEAVRQTSRNDSYSIVNMLRNLFRTLGGMPKDDSEKTQSNLPANFKSQLPPIKLLDEKIAALKIIEHYCTFARLVRDGDLTISALPPLNYLLNTEIPRVLKALVSYLPDELKHIDNPQALTEFSGNLAVEYIASVFSNPAISAEVKAELCNFVVERFDDVAKIQSDFTLISKNPEHNDLRRRVRSERDLFSARQRTQIYSLIAPYLDDKELIKLSIAVFGRITENLKHFGYELESESFQRISWSQACELPVLVESFSKELILRRSLEVDDSDRQILLHNQSYFINVLDSDSHRYKSWHATPQSVRIRGLAQLFGEGERGISRLAATLSIPRKRLRDPIFALIKEYGAEEVCPALKDPTLNSTFSEILGGLLFLNLKSLPLNSSGLEGFRELLAQVKSSGKPISILANRDNISDWIRLKTQSLEETRNYFNPPTAQNPCSELLFSLSKGQTTYLWRVLAEFRSSVTGLSLDDICNSWFKVDEAAILPHLARQLIPDFSYRHLSMVLTLDDSDESRSEVPICCYPEMFERFFVDYDTENNTGPGQIDFLNKAILDRQPTTAPVESDPIYGIFYRAKEKFPSQWKFITGEAPESPLRAKYQALRLEALRLAFQRAVDGLDSQRISRPGQLYISMVSFQEWYIPIHRKLLNLCSGDGLKAVLNTAALNEPNKSSSQYRLLSQKAKELGIITSLLLKFAASADQFSAIKQVLNDLGFNDDLIDLFVCSQLPQGTKPSIKDFWNAAYAPPTDSSQHANFARTICTRLPEISAEASWKLRSRQDRFQQFLVSPTSSVVSPASSGDFDDFRPFTNGDDPALIHHQSSARLGRPLVRKFTEEESRNLHLIIDVQSLVSSYYQLIHYNQINGGLHYLASVLEFSKMEGLAVDLTIMGRTKLRHFENLQLPHRSDKIAKSSTPEFWKEILELVAGAAKFIQMESSLFESDSGFSYNPFAQETPRFKAGQFNLFSVHSFNITGAKKLAESLQSRGVLVSLQKLD